MLNTRSLLTTPSIAQSLNRSIAQVHELTEDALRTENAVIDKECKDLQADVVRMAGHQNGKQKIHYLQKVKQDNLALKQDNARLEKEVARIKQQLAKVRGAGRGACVHVVCVGLLYVVLRTACGGGVTPRDLLD